MTRRIICGVKRADGALCQDEPNHYGGHIWPDARIEAQKRRDRTEKPEHKTKQLKGQAETLIAPRRSSSVSKTQRKRAVVDMERLAVAAICKVLETADAGHNNIQVQVGDNPRSNQSFMELNDYIAYLKTLYGI